MKQEPKLEELLNQAFQRFGDKVAVIDDARRLTYRELRDEVGATIAGLHDLGVSPRGRIAHVAGASVESLVIDVACYTGGFTRVPINPRAHHTEVLDMVRRARAEVLIDPAAGAHDQVAYLQECDSLGSSGRFDRGSFLGASKPVERPLRPHWDAEDPPASIAFTSGTTGHPKGAVHSAKAMLASGLGIASALDLAAQDVLMLPLPLSNIGGHLALAGLLRGTTVVLRRSWSPESFVADQRDLGASVLVGVPTMFRGLLPYASQIAPGALRRLVYGAAPTPIDDIVRLRESFGPVLTQMYGQTEVGIVSTLGVRDHDFDPAAPPARLASAGRPVAAALISVVDADGRRLPVGEVGEVVVRSGTGLTEYLDDPEASKAALTADGSVRTGDLGRFDEDGYLHIVGRLKEVIISGGYNVYPLEVETAIRDVPGVLDVSVLGVADAHWGEVVTACVVWEPAVEGDPAAVQAMCRSRLAGYKVPKQVHSVGDLPRNASGKVDKEALRRVIGP